MPLTEKIMWGVKKWKAGERTGEEEKQGRQMGRGKLRDDIYRIPMNNQQVRGERTDSSLILCIGWPCFNQYQYSNQRSYNMHTLCVYRLSLNMLYGEQHWGDEKSNREFKKTGNIGAYQLEMKIRAQKLRKIMYVLVGRRRWLEIKMLQGRVGDSEQTG